MITDEQLSELIDVFRLKSAYEETALDWAGQQPNAYTESMLSALRELQRRRQKEDLADIFWKGIFKKVADFYNEEK